jgi:hypothetical protein
MVMTGRARTTARRALGLLGRVPLELLRSAWPSLLLLILWVTFAGPMWEGFTAIAAEPGGGRALFLFFGTLWVLSMLISDIHRCRHRTRTTVTLPAPLARMTSHLTPPEVLRRRARHEAAHAVAGWALGGKILALDIQPVADRGGQCSFSLEEITDPTERNWVHLVICMAGNQADLANGHHDDGAQADLVQALVAAAAIISTGRTPNDHRGELTSDELLSTARRRATALLSTHDQLLDQVMQRLLDHPHESWCNPDLDALAQAPAA